MARILLIDDDPDLSHFLREELEKLGHVVECLEGAELAPERLVGKPFDVVLLDNKMPGMSGLEFLEKVRDRGIEVPVILMTGVPTSSTAIRATKLRALQYVIKPSDFQELVLALQPVIERVLEGTRENARQPEAEPIHRTPPETPKEPELVGNSKLMLEVYDRIGLFAESGDTVLILGETGTGKELVARAIHNESPRNGPFEALNCGAIAKDLLEAELFGHEPGAYTGAVGLRKGKIENADGGTLFLDEIGDLPLPAQATLLRVLQERKFERVGGSKPVKVDVRVLAATHRDLTRMVREGEFRRDLFFRLDGITIRLPPLRERLDDIPNLVEDFITQAAQDANRPRLEIAKEALERLRAHPLRWPGNVRELKNVVSRAFRLCRSPKILPSHIDFQTAEVDVPPPTPEADALAALHKTIAWAWDTNQQNLWPLLRDLLERELLKEALKRLDGNQSQVAERLDMARNTVIKRMQAYGLK